MTKRIYYIRGERYGESHHLVRASNAGQAVRHVTAKHFTVAVASQDDLVELTVRGVKVEDAIPEPISTGEPQSPGSPDGDTDGTGCAAPVEASRASPQQLDIERDIPPDLDRRVPRQA